MEPIYEFNEFLKKQIEIFQSSRWNFEHFHFRWKRVSLRENVSLRLCQKCVNLGVSTVLYLCEFNAFVSSFSGFGSAVPEGGMAPERGRAPAEQRFNQLIILRTKSRMMFFNLKRTTQK